MPVLALTWPWPYPRLRGFWENVPCLHFKKKKKIQVEISSRTLISLFVLGTVHIGSASWEDCDQMFPDKLRVRTFPDKFPQYAWTAA